MSSRDDSRIFDVRTLDRNLRKGLLSRKEVDKHMKALPDAADKSTVCNPEAQGREPPERVHRVVVVATAAVVADDADDLLDDEAIDDDDDDDEDEDEADASPAK